MAILDIERTNLKNPSSPIPYPQSLKMKLLYITNGINGSGGLERVLSVKASLLADQYDYEVYILSLNGADQNPFYTFSPNVKMHSIQVAGNPIQYFTQYKKGLQQTVDQIQPDVISVCDDGLKGFFVPSILKTRAKIIYERHASVQLNTNNSLKGKLIKLLMTRQIPTFDHFVVLTQGNAEEWQSKNVRVIPNPLSFQSVESSDLQQQRVIAVGTHSHNKGYDLLLESWQEVEKKHPAWQLDIFGKIIAERGFVQLAKQMQLKNVHFHDPVADIQSEYLKSSIMVLSSRSEGFGMVLIEAMECGVPCVAFDCPSGPGDIIQDGKDGFLIENGNVESFTQKLLELIEKPELRKQFGQQAKINVQRYSANEIVKLWDGLFRGMKG